MKGTQDLHVQSYRAGLSQLNGTSSIIIELIEASETPAVVIIRWPAKASVLHPRRFPPLPIWLHESSLLPS